MKQPSFFSRRSFLKDTGKAALSCCILPRHVLGGKGYTAPSDRLTLAVIGAGYQGKKDMLTFNRTGKVNVGYVCDTDELALKTSSRWFPRAKCYPHYQPLLDKSAKFIDGAVIATPDFLHGGMGLAAIQQDKHVYIQSPLSRNIRETRTLLACAAGKKVIVYMATDAVAIGPRPMQGPFNTVLCYNTSNDFLRDWSRDWRYGTGSLGTTGAGLLSLALEVLDDRQPYQLSFCTQYSNGLQRDNQPHYLVMPDLSHVLFHFRNPGGTADTVVHWMDGIRPAGAGPANSGMIIEGTAGKLVHSPFEEFVPAPNLPQLAWIQACQEGFDSPGALKVRAELQRAAAVSELVTLANAAIRSYGIAKIGRNTNKFIYPGHYLKLQWDSIAMQTGSPDADQFL